jgi:hypothetical protein
VSPRISQEPFRPRATEGNVFRKTFIGPLFIHERRADPFPTCSSFSLSHKISYRVGIAITSRNTINDIPLFRRYRSTRRPYPTDITHHFNSLFVARKTRLLLPKPSPSHHPIPSMIRSQPCSHIASTSLSSFAEFFLVSFPRLAYF